MKKFLLILAVVTGFLAGPMTSSLFASVNPTQSQQEEIPHQVLNNIFDQLDQQKLCTKCQAENWWRSGAMQISKIAPNTYRVEVSGGGLETIVIVASF